MAIRTLSALKILTAFKRSGTFAGALLLCIGARSEAAADSATLVEHPAWEKSGDLLQWVIPMAGLGLSFLLDAHERSSSASESLFDAPSIEAPGLNWPGPHLGRSPQRDFLIAFVRMEVATYAIKYSLNTKRPNGGSQSFPSGHTSAAFMGAEFIRRHYGIGWGVPAYAAASWVGYTRVESHNHYWYDVLGGALIGIASNYDFDRVDTPVGQLRIGLSGLNASLGGGFGFDESRAADFDPLPPVPGLLFELQF